MYTMNEKFKAVSSLCPPAIIYNELCSDIVTGKADIFEMDGDSRQELSENGCQYNAYVRQLSYVFRRPLRVEVSLVMCIQINEGEN